MLELLKIKKDINWLIEQIRCLIKKNDLDCPLAATEWSPNHSVALGNPYILDCFVWLNGHVYKSLIDNNIYPPTNDCYWEDLGEGHLLLEEQSNWNATTGRAFIPNKPTNTSDFTNDGEDGSSPFATLNDLSAAIPLAQDLDSVLTEGDTAADKQVNVESVGLWDNFTAPFGFARITADKSRINFISKLGNSMLWIAEGSFALIKGAFTFTFNTQTLTSNRIATFQNASGVVAYLSDIIPQDLVATMWNPNHTFALGNQYLPGTRVFYAGNIYQALSANDAIIPTNATYWLDLGPGYLLDQSTVGITGSYNDLLDQPFIPTVIDDLSDVTISSPLNGQIIRYNDTTSQWENVSVPIGPGDMQKTTYDTDNDGIVDKAEVIAVIVRNTSLTTTLIKGQIVYLNGATGNRPNAFLAQANTEATSSGTFGVVTSDIASNSDGEIAMLGTLHNLATNGSSPFTLDTLVEGDLLWLSPTTPGFVTNIKPNAPNHIVFIGIVARVHPNLGRIAYRITNGYELEELHNVSTLGRQLGETIMWNSVLNVWENKSIAGILGYTPADDATFLYKKFMTNHFSYMLPGENSTYNLLRTNTTSGYLTTGTVATLSQMPMGISYTSPSPSNSVAAVYGAPMRIQLSNAQDFTFQRKWKIQITNTVQRYFVGITNKYLSAVPVNADQSLFLNTLGVVKLSTSDNWFFIYNDGTGVAGLVDCGVLFPATNAYTYSLKIQKVKGATSLTMTLTRIDSTGNTIEVSEVVNSTDYNTGVDYYPAIWASNNTATFSSQFYDQGCMLLKSTI